ncbi:MAG: hypothetical protein KBC78_02920 [Candidatus Pacebacteria bacterium]|nr:hypothetical protein [Candidatus Paceibacterota bacterium]
MGAKTKNIFITSILITVLSVGTCSFLIYQIGAKGVLLEEKVKILAENNSKEESYLSIRRTIQETESERGEINSKFFKGEDDSIVFLTQIESLAPKLGLVFATKSLDPVVDENNKLQSIKMSFTYSGKKDSVLDFTKMLENIQYHSYLENLTLKKDTEDNWSGAVTLLISIDPS